MELSDVFEKLANNARLTPDELQFLKISMRQTQTNNAYITGLQNGSSEIRATTINANKLITGSREISGVFSQYTSSDTIPTGAETAATTWGKDDYVEENGITTSSGWFYLRESGRYLVILSVDWAVNATGVRYVLFRTNEAHYYRYETPIASTAYPQRDIVFEVYLKAGLSFQISGYQTSGGDLNLRFKLQISRVGAYRFEPT